MEYQQQSHLHYNMRPPPPPPLSDPNHHQPAAPPPPAGSTWFSGQFEFHGHNPSPNPSHQQWAPPPPQYSVPPLAPYPAPPPYPAHHQYHPPRPHHSQIPQSYPHHLNQDWQNPNWGHQQGWEYPAPNNGEDWAAKARSWAAAKSTDDQYPQSQFSSVGIMEENQYPVVNTNHSDAQHLQLPTSSYQQYPPAAPHYRPPESASFSSGYVPDGHLPFTARNETLTGDSSAAFHSQESSASSLSTVHQQEVPSSYSSVAENGETSDQNENFYKSYWTFTSAPQHHASLPPASDGKSVSVEKPRYAFGQQSAEPTSNLSDQPLNFTPRFSHDPDPHMQSNYTHDSRLPVRGMNSVSSVPSIHDWNSSSVPAAIYPPMHPSGSQVDPSLAIHSPIPGHSGPLFGRMPGQSFQSMVPAVSAPFVTSTGNFPGDSYGASVVSDRPKKAAVPNWLREELIKNKAAITSSALELSEEKIKSIEEEELDKSLQKGDPADGKSFDSSRSTEEEDEDEDEVEAARTAAINQEIKRVLTEVLLKVTDELFDEIATKVLGEEDSSVGAASNYEVSSSIPVVPTPNASAKVLISSKSEESDTNNVSGKSTFSAPGDVLGLGDYASDDDEDDYIQKFAAPNSRRSIIHQPITTKSIRDDLAVVGNGSPLSEAKEHENAIVKGESHLRGMSLHGSSDGNNNNGEIVVNGINMPKDMVDEKVVKKNDPPVEKFSDQKSMSDDSGGRGTRNIPDKNDSKRSTAGKYLVKEAEGEGTHVRGDESHRRQDEKKSRKEKTDDRNASKERIKEPSSKYGKKSKECEIKKRSSHPPDDKEGRKESERDRRTSGKEDNGRKRERTKDEKEERSRHKLATNSRKHKRCRSSSVDSRGRSRKNQSVGSYTNDSSDVSSDVSKRKIRTRRRNLSPSPVRSRRRQVSRSPHSKHPQRRHSPYSSLETTRKLR